MNATMQGKPVRFWHVFAVAAAGALFAVAGMAAALRIGAPQAGAAPARLSNCHRAASNPDLIACTAQLPVVVLLSPRGQLQMNRPQMKTPAAATAGVL
jgi:hypothetical protein